MQCVWPEHLLTQPDVDPKYWGQMAVRAGGISHVNHGIHASVHDLCAAFHKRGVLAGIDACVA